MHRWRPEGDFHLRDFAEIRNAGRSQIYQIFKSGFNGERPRGCFSYIEPNIANVGYDRRLSSLGFSRSGFIVPCIFLGITLNFPTVLDWYI